MQSMRGSGTVVATIRQSRVNLLAALLIAAGGVLLYTAAQLRDQAGVHAALRCAAGQCHGAMQSTDGDAPGCVTTVLFHTDRRTDESYETEEPGNHGAGAASTNGTLNAPASHQSSFAVRQSSGDRSGSPAYEHGAGSFCRSTTGMAKHVALRTNAQNAALYRGAAVPVGMIGRAPAPPRLPPPPQQFAEAPPAQEQACVSQQGQQVPSVVYHV